MKYCILRMTRVMVFLILNSRKLQIFGIIFGHWEIIDKKYVYTVLYMHFYIREREREILEERLERKRERCICLFSFIAKKCCIMMNSFLLVIFFYSFNLYLRHNICLISRFSLFWFMPSSASVNTGVKISGRRFIKE